METRKVAEKYNVSKSTVIKWCQKNNIRRRIGANGIMEYVITDRDMKRFENRKKLSRPK